MSTPDERSERADQAQGVIYQQGYRHYQGRYLGRFYAVVSLAWSDGKRALGIGRGWKYKLGFFILVGILLIIALIAFGTNVVTERIGAGGQSRSFYPFANPYNGFFDSANGIILWLLLALIIPDLLCNDRRYGTLRLYLARPISLVDYLAAKALAIVGVLSAVLLAPVLLLFLAKALGAAQPGAYLAAHLGDLGALLISSLLFAVYYALISGALASLTKSTGYAAAGIVGLLIAARLIGSTVFAFTHRRMAALIDLGQLVGQIKSSLFGVNQPLITLNIQLHSGSEPVTPVIVQPYPVWVYLLAALAVGLLGALVIGWRYRREVER